MSKLNLRELFVCFKLSLLHEVPGSPHNVENVYAHLCLDKAPFRFEQLVSESLRL